MEIDGDTPFTLAVNPKVKFYTGVLLLGKLLHVFYNI